MGKRNGVGSEGHEPDLDRRIRQAIQERFADGKWRTLEEMKKQEPKIRTSALYPSGMSQAVLQMDYVAEAKKIKADMVSPHYRTTTAEKVAQAHAAGMQVVPWTANDAATWQKLVDAKVDAIISDDPAALMAWLKEKGLR